MMKGRGGLCVAPAPHSKGTAMKKAMVVALSDEELLNLCRVIIYRDDAGALAFLDRFLAAHNDGSCVACL